MHIHAEADFLEVSKCLRFTTITNHTGCSSKAQHFSLSTHADSYIILLLYKYWLLKFIKKVNSNGISDRNEKCFTSFGAERKQKIIGLGVSNINQFVILWKPWKQNETTCLIKNTLLSKTMFYTDLSLNLNWFPFSGYAKLISISFVLIYSKRFFGN